MSVPVDSKKIERQTSKLLKIKWELFQNGLLFGIGLNFSDE